MVYKHEQPYGDRVDIFATAIEPGIHIQTSPKGCHIPDDEIPAVIAALQAHMSRRAREMTKAASK